VDEKKAIILKIKHRDPVLSHGSSWKVAYADFVTALMAFFLLMWLVAMIAPAKRAEMARYFKGYSLAGKSSQSQSPKAQTLKAADEPPAPFVSPTEKLRSDLAEVIKSRLGDLRDQVLVDTFDAGVRVQVVDKQGSLMFDVGSARFTEDAKKALKVIAESIQSLDHKIAVEGHTDALSYSSNKYTNWELSTDRASAARRELEQHGLNPDRLVKVAGYAAVDPLIKGNPYAPQNRRISILIYDQKESPPPMEEMPPMTGSREKTPEKTNPKAENHPPTPSGKTEGR
jgi:chemotaxis protein MotB